MGCAAVVVCWCLAETRADLKHSVLSGGKSPHIIRGNANLSFLRVSNFEPDCHHGIADDLCHRWSKSTVPSGPRRPKHSTANRNIIKTKCKHTVKNKPLSCRADVQQPHSTHLQILRPQNLSQGLLSACLQRVDSRQRALSAGNQLADERAGTPKSHFRFCVCSLYPSASTK